MSESEQPSTSPLPAPAELPNVAATSNVAQVPPERPNRALPSKPIQINTQSLLGLADALLRAPERAMTEINGGAFGLLRLCTLVIIATALTGLTVASFSGGFQYAAVPLKLVSTVILGALLCLPSLYIFSCLSECHFGIRAVAIALFSGLGVQALLLCGFAPVAWVFSQSTNSVAFMGGLHLVMYLISNTVGLSVTKRLLALDGHPIRIFGLWQLLFLIVSLQLTTTLRPIVGPFDAQLEHAKLFFLTHWVQCLFQ